MIYHYVKNINNKQKQNATMFFQHANMNTVLGPTCLQMKSLFQSNDEKVGKQKRKKKTERKPCRPLPPFAIDSIPPFRYKQQQGIRAAIVFSLCRP